MRYKIRHLTEYTYSERVSNCYNMALIKPLDNDRQQCIFHNVYVNPYPSNVTHHKDYFGNTACHFDIQKPHEQITITAESEVDILTVNDTPLNNTENLDITVGMATDLIKNGLSLDILNAREYLLDSMMIKNTTDFLAYAAPSFAKDRPLTSAVTELTARIFNEFTYDPAFTTVATPLANVLQEKRGVCQDFAHLQIACLRALGIPAKYVSGYIETLPPPGQKKLRGVDATHAWIAYFSPQRGWIEHDPTNNTRITDQYIVTAYGRDFYDVTPIKGVIYGGGNNPVLRVSVDVARVK